uniref:ras association domain-containing protein 5-like isoform X3 n=1 Tax=Oncorhynchus gorbuscha TaxID=8017 RepID=UPI001EAF1497|nr:ras association domain-containing protein 5-like isoform X3 [Oncorhynchus gorbuscha]
MGRRVEEGEAGESGEGVSQVRASQSLSLRVRAEVGGEGEGELGGEDGDMGSACFGQVSRRLGRLLRRLPKSRSWSDGLRMLRRTSSNGSLINSSSDCNYTCHQECGGRVQLDCNQRDSNPRERTSPRRHCSTPPQYKQKDVEEERGPKALSEEELRAKIEDYNSTVSENGMKLGADGLYTGFIKVHLRLSRPVTVLAVEGTGLDGQAERRPMTVSEGQEGAGAGFSEKRTSFYLPSDCVKQIHISSTTTVREVIQGLLKKFMVQDNPRKFALYRQTHRDGQDLFQKLPLVECPLALRLVVGPDPELLSFVLKENETGEVEWHAFSVPELQNFLVILEKEEAERVRLVEQRFAVYRQSLQKALREDQP